MIPVSPEVKQSDERVAGRRIGVGDGGGAALGAAGVAFAVDGATGAGVARPAGVGEVETRPLPRCGCAA